MQLTLEYFDQLQKVSGKGSRAESVRTEYVGQ